MKTKAKHALQAAVIVLAVGWVFWPAIHGGWVWDDFAEIVRNPVLRDPAGIRKIWLAPVGADYFPLKATAQWVEWHLWAESTLGYHLVNVGLHLLSVFLLWHLLRKLGVRCAWLGSLLFAIHPIVVESVAWIAEFKNTLSLPFLLLAFSAWIDWDRERDMGFQPMFINDTGKLPVPRQSRFQVSGFKFKFLEALLCFLAAMLSKSSVVMFPFVLLLYAWWKRGRVGVRDFLATVPFFLVSLVLGAVTVVFQQQRAIEGVDLATGGLWARCAGAGLAGFFYLWKCVFPVGLMPHYPLWHLNPPTLLEFWPWAAIAAVFVGLVAQASRLPSPKVDAAARCVPPTAAGGDACATFSGFRFPPSSLSKNALFGLGWFALNLLPVLGFVPMAYLRISWVADHFAYLPLIGLVGLAAAGASKIFQVSSFRFQVFSSFLIAALLAALAISSHRYARIFSSDEALWTYTLQRNPDSWAAHNDLGMDLAQRGRVTEAIEHYETALRLKPDDPAAHINLGNVLARLDRVSEAVAQYEAALRTEPGNIGARADLGNALVQSGQYSAAIVQFEKVIGLKPDFAEAHYGLAYAHYQLGNASGNAGRFPEAIAQYSEALRFRPDYAEAHANLGLALVNTGRPQDAIPQLEQALQLKSGYEEAHAYLGFALASAGRMGEAIAQYQRALELNPGDSDVHYNLAVALRQEGRTAEANLHFEAAARLSAGH